MAARSALESEAGVPLKPVITSPALITDAAGTPDCTSATRMVSGTVQAQLAAGRRRWPAPGSRSSRRPSPSRPPAASARAGRPAAPARPHRCATPSLHHLQQRQPVPGTAEDPRSSCRARRSSGSSGGRSPRSAGGRRRCPARSWRGRGCRSRTARAAARSARPAARPGTPRAMMTAARGPRPGRSGGAVGKASSLTWSAPCPSPRWPKARRGTGRTPRPTARHGPDDRSRRPHQNPATTTAVVTTGTSHQNQNGAFATDAAETR